MKIIHVIRSLHKGGAEKFCVDICKELSKRENIEVLLVSMSPTNEFLEFTKKINLRICNSKVVLSISGKSIINTNEFIDIVNEYKPDVIHSHLFWSELMSRATTFKNIKYFTHCHDNMVEFRNFSIQTLFTKDVFVRFYEKLWLINKYKKCNNTFIAISKDTSRYFQSVLPDSLKKVKLLHNAIDFNYYHNASLENRIFNNKLYLINIGRFAVYKNQTFLLDVTNELLKDGIDVELSFLGVGSEFEKVKERASQMNLNHTIKFLGNVSNVPTHLAQSHIYVHASTQEGFGLVLLEAMAAGLPVVTLNGKGNKDIIDEGKNGYMFDKQDAKLFAKKIALLWQDKRLYKDISEHAVETAKEYDIKQYVDKLLALYRGE